jgi:hypothetical protein
VTGKAGLLVTEGQFGSHGEIVTGDMPIYFFARPPMFL